MSDDNLKTWPERIWLQHGEEEVPDFEARYVGIEDMTWCHDKMDGADVEYVRADRITELERQNAETVNALQNLVVEFKRVFPIYYYAEPWAHDRNVVLKHAESVLAAPHQQSDEKGAGNGP